MTEYIIICLVGCFLGYTFTLFRPHLQVYYLDVKYWLIDTYRRRKAKWRK